MLSLISFEISSKAGAIALQGPHHSAQKSTKTGFDESSTSFLKFLSVVFKTGIFFSYKNLVAE